MKWTENQKKAIEYRGGNLLVAAGAGAGKTGVLSRRIIARLEEGHHIDELLVLTFTRAAAKEMRDRIRKNIYEHLAMNKKHFSRQLLLLSDAPIMTLHSFCLLLLRRHFNLLPDMEPKFKILDPNQAKVVREDLLRDFFERQYLDGDIHRRDRFLRLLRCFGDRLSDDGLKKQILDLMDFGQSEGDLSEWTKDALDRYYDREFWRKMAAENIKENLFAAKEVFLDASEYCKMAEGPEGYYEVLLEDIRYMEQLLRADWDQMKEIKLSFARLSGKKKTDDPVVAERVKKRRDNGKELAKKAMGLAGAEENDEAHRKVGEDLDYLVELTLAFEEEYRNYKRKKGWMEFSDLEHYAHHLLRDNPGLAEEYRRRFLEIFVDEYQDINGLQGKILSYLSNGENLFMVGDVKQSIYGFRGANHHLFQGLYEAFGYEAPNDRGLLVLLNDNFRSRPAILTGVNFVFSQVMTEKAVGLAYDQKASLRPGRTAPSQAETALEFLFVCERQENEIDDDFDYPEKVQAQARIIGEKIDELIDCGCNVEENGALRPVSYGDFAILLRNDKGRIRVIEETLKDRGIPVEAAGDDGSRGQEIRILVALLAVLDNPRQDIPLAAVLRSPLFHFDEEAMFTVGKREKGKKLWDALHREYPEPLAGQVTAFLETIAAWRLLSRRHGVGDLLLLILEESDYRAFWSALPNGRQRIHHILAFQERALAFQEQQLGGIFAFLRYMERLEEKPCGESGLGQGDTVKVVTMHRAKGLEFPIVFLANLEHKFNQEDSKSLLSLHRKLGFAPKVKDWSIRVRYPTLARHIVDREKKKEGIAEEMRVLYVAMTRAKEKLFLVAGEKEMGEWQSKFDKCRYWPGELLSKGDILSASSYLSWLGMAFGRHPDLGGSKSLPYQDFSVSLTEKPAPGPFLRRGTFGKEKAAVLPLDRLQAFAGEPQKHLPLKVTVTELLPKTTTVKRPRFQKADILTGAERGTAFHRLMEALPLEQEWTLASLLAFEEEMREKEILREEEIATLDNPAVLAFLHSSYGLAIRSSRVLKKEMAFTAGFPANRLFPVENEEKILLQGAVDLLFQGRDGNWFLLDYKNMALRDPAAFLQVYRRQMELYCEAVESLYHIKIKEGAFYLTKARDFIQAYPNI